MRIPLLSLCAFALLAGSAQAAPGPVVKKPVTKLPIKSSPKVDPSIRVVDSSKVTGRAPLSKAQIAKLAGVSPAALGEPVTLSPAHTIDGSTYLAFHCARYVDPSKPYAYFLGSLFDACGTDVGVVINLRTEAGHNYMVDCVGDPGEGNMWHFGRTGAAAWQSSKALDRVIFVFTALHTEHVDMSLRANAYTSYKIERCTITPLGA